MIFTGWRDSEDGHGGEQVCKNCGLGAMVWSMRYFAMTTPELQRGAEALYERLPTTSSDAPWCYLSQHERDDYTEAARACVLAMLPVGEMAVNEACEGFHCTNRPTIFESMQDALVSFVNHIAGRSK